MAGPRQVLEFDPYEPAAVVGHMNDLAAAGAGWINLWSLVDEPARERAAGLFQIFSARGPAVPLCTWVARERTRKDVEYVSIGIQHPAGPRAVAALSDAGHDVPEGWMVLQDHSRRGLVVALPVTESHERVLAWLFMAARLLSPQPLPDRWQAAVYG